MLLARFRMGLVLLSLVSAGCAGRQPRPTAPTENQLSAAVTAENFTDVLRNLDEQEPSTASRRTRDSSTRFLAQRGMERLEDGDLEGAINFLSLAMNHYTPDELRGGGLPDELRPFLQAILAVVSPRGDESTVLASYRILRALAHPDPDAQQQYDRVREWGERNRREFRLPWVYHGEMSEVFSEAARIVPAPELLDQAVEEVLQRREAATNAMGRMNLGRRLTMEESRQLQYGARRTEIDIAMLHLRRGDLQSAVNDTARGSGNPQGGLTALLRANATGEAGAAGLLDLANRLEHVDPRAMAGVCRAGRRAYPNEARFARCLGAVYARQQLFGLASAHLDAATRLSNEEELFRAALSVTVEWIEREHESDEAIAGRRAILRAREILQRWPREGTPPAVTAADVDLLAGRFELAFGNLEPARTHLERAIAGTPPPRDAFLTLGEIAWRRGDPRRAVDLFGRGLALPLRPSESDSTFRPLFQLRLGQAKQASGDTAGGTRLIEEAETNLGALVRSLQGEERGQALLLQAQAQAILGRTAEVPQTLQAAIASAPDSQGVAAQAISLMMSSRRWSEAHELARSSRGHLTLDRRWGVYFALWSALSARNAGVENDHGASDFLTEVSSNAGPGSMWTTRLAQRYAGSLSREELLRLAHTPGQRAEALFYEALRALPSDAAAAERDLRAVLETDVLLFHEFEMAWRLLERPATTASPSASR